MDDLSPCPRCGNLTYIRAKFPSFRNSQPRRCDPDGWFHICELPAVNLSPSMEEWCAMYEEPVPAMPKPKPVHRPEPAPIPAAVTKPQPQRQVRTLVIP